MLFSAVSGILPFVPTMTVQAAVAPEADFILTPPSMVGVWKGTGTVDGSPVPVVFTVTPEKHTLELGGAVSGSIAYTSSQGKRAEIDDGLEELALVELLSVLNAKTHYIFVAGGIITSVQGFFAEAGAKVNDPIGVPTILNRDGQSLYLPLGGEMVFLLYKQQATTASQLTTNLTAVTYNGSPQAVSVTPKSGIGAVTDIFYNGSKTVPQNAGTYAITVNVAANGNYQAATNLPLGNFTINKANISTVSIPAIPDKEWSGKQHKPTIAEFKHAGISHGANLHATISHGTNKNIGKGTVVLTGKGNFTGSKTVSFNIVPKKNKLTKLTVGKKQMNLTWAKPDKAQNITKHELRYRVKGTSKWTTKTYTATKTSATLGKLTANKKYEVQLRSYKTVSAKKYYSPWSPTKTSGKIK
jgi:hypothetical protein